MGKEITLDIVYGNKSYVLTIDKDIDYDEFLSKIFLKITNIKSPDNLEDNKKFIGYIFEKFETNFYLTWITKQITKSNWDEIKDIIEANDTIFISNKLKGGFFSIILVVLGIFGILSPVLKPVRAMFQVIIEIFNLVGKFIEWMITVIEIIPTIFDPPRLIDDILFAITSSINLILSKFSGDIKNLYNSPEDDTAESGPFGVSNENRNAYSCMDPSWSQILLLVICPPLAIIYKLGFWAGFISSIICGVLCVKLYYFPGLLFAILHVLC
tara:strand:- start:235 stop:1041 length:807 start_codon:yes stop_codon:yes gene_type:complete